MHFIDGKGQKSELRNSRNVLTNHLKFYHATSYLWPRGCTHTHKHTHILAHMKVISRNQAVGWRVPGLKIPDKYAIAQTYQTIFELHIIITILLSRIYVAMQYV